MSEKAKMLAGELYLANEEALVQERKRAKVLCARYNAGGVADRAILRELLGAPTDAHLEPPFFCDYGYNIRLGTNVYSNHNLVILDCAPVDIGDNVFIGPNVVISTAGHPIDPAVRISGLEFAKPITIGNGVSSAPARAARTSGCAGSRTRRAPTSSTRRASRRSIPGDGERLLRRWRVFRRPACSSCPCT